MTTVAFPPGGRPEQALVEAVAAVAADAPAELPGGLALERARVLLAEIERLKLLGLQALADVEARQLYALDGAGTLPAWVHALPAAGVNAADVTLARRLAALSAVEGELLAGRLSAAAAGAVARAVGVARPFLDRPDGRIDGQPGEQALYGTMVDGVCMLLAEQTGGATADDPEQDALRAELEAIIEVAGSQADRVEAGLVLFARRCQPALLASGLATLLDALLPAEHDKKAAAADDKAGLDLRRDPDSGGWTIKGNLDAETGEMLHTVLLAEQQVDPAGPADTDAWRTAAEQPGLDTVPPHDWPVALARPRSRRQRHHDALRAALRRLLDSGTLGLRDKVRPHLLITVPLDYLNELPGALPARAASGARWSRRQLRRLACDTALTRLVLDAGGRIIEASHTERTLKGFERRILHAQWGGRCAGTGCTRGPASGHTLIPHHATPYAKSGQTSLADSVPFCELDHHELHDNQRPIQLKDGRWLGPDGWIDRPPR